jgi:hypothetical protein
MKRSRLLIRNTLLALSGMVVLSVGINRLFAVAEPPPVQQRTSATELAALRDFDAIEVSGDFTLDIVQQAGFAVEVVPPDASQGVVVATMRESTLVLRGVRNAAGGRVRVAMPVLRQVSAYAVPALSVSGFNGDSLSLLMERVPLVVLRGNGIRQWHIVASQKGELQIDRATFSAGKVDLAGHATLTVVD